jgi:excisionase family DNA binding protein
MAAKGSQALATTGDGEDCGVQPSQPKQMFLRGFATPLLRPNVTEGAGTESMLTVRDVARRLKVSTATVYKLCTRGELGHVQVLNAIRIPAEALAEFAEASAGRKA